MAPWLPTLSNHMHLPGVFSSDMLRCCAPLQIGKGASKNERNLYASGHHTGGVSTFRNPAELQDGGQIQIFSFPIPITRT